MICVSAIIRLHALVSFHCYYHISCWFCTACYYSITICFIVVFVTLHAFVSSASIAVPHLLNVFHEIRYAKTNCFCWLSANVIVTMISEGGMMRSETLVDLKFGSSSFRANIFQFELFELVPLTELRQTVACRAIRGKSSSSRQQ